MHSSSVGSSISQQLINVFHNNNKPLSLFAENLVL